MSKNINQVYTANPITSNLGTDLMYFGRSPYAPGNDTAMTYANFAAQFVPSTSPSSLQGAMVYVDSINGNDSGNGSFNKPYKTIAYAMSSISSPGPTNVYTIVLLSNLYSETSQIILKENVNIFAYSYNTLIRNSMPVILSSSSWTSVYPYSSFTNVQFNGAVNIDFSITSPTAYPQIFLVQCAFYGGFSFNGGLYRAPNGTSILYAYNCLFNSAFSCDNAANFNSFGNAYHGTFNFGSVSVGNANLGQSFGDYIATTLNIAGTSGAGAQTYTLSGSTVNAITIGGSNATLNIDTSSYVTPSVTGSPTINLTNISNGLKANYTPSNYTPVATAPTLTTSVQAHLHGIDNALGGSGGSPANVVYFSINGSDVTGTGSFTKPFASLSFSMASITGASPAENYNIVALDGPYTDTGVISLKPNVDIFALSSGTAIYNSQTVVMDSSWNGTNGSTAYYSNVTFFGAVDFDFTTSTASSPIIQMDTVYFQNTFTLNGGTTIPYVSSYSCYFNSGATIDNTNYYSYLNTYSTPVLAGTGSYNSFTDYTAIADQYAGATFSNTVLFSDNVYTITACSGLDPLTLSGTHVILNIDSSSYVTPTISSGSPTINLLSISDGINANYNPTYYVPVATAPNLTVSVQANLRGIDTALGQIGNYFSTSNTGVSLTSGTPSNIASLSLPAGNWEISGVIGFFADTTTTVSQIACAVNTTSATLPAFPSENNIQLLTASFGVGSSNYLNCGPTRISLSSTTTIYLVGRASFAISTMSSSGFLKAVRATTQP